MSEQNNTRSLFSDGLAIGVGIGLFSGILSTIWVKKNKVLDSNYVLNKIKQAFLAEGPIEGSWIECEEQPFRKFAIHTEVYSGGISRIEDQQLVNYEFLADARTGSVLDVHRVAVGSIRSLTEL